MEAAGSPRRVVSSIPWVKELWRVGSAPFRDVMRRMTAGRAALAVALGAGAGVAFGAGPIRADDGSPPSVDGGHYESVVTAVSPAVDGISAEVADATQVTLRNTSRQTVVVLGYGNEPYLRFTPTGVDENVASPTSAVNTRGNVAPLPGTAAGDPRNLPVHWLHRTDQPRFTWPDYRVGWSVPMRPPAVAADPGSARQITTWGLPITVDGRPGVVTGQLRWAVAGRAWWAASVAVVGFLLPAGAVAAAVFVRRRRRPGAPAAASVSRVSVVAGAVR